MKEVYYSAARDAINNRVKLRDSVLIFYLASVATIFGAAFGTSLNTDLLLMVPFVALGASFMLSQHHTTIGSIVRYLALELNSPEENATNIIHWDVSKSATNKNKKSMSLIVNSHIVLVIFPALAALLYKVREIEIFSQEGVFFGFGFFALVVGLIIILKAHKYRSKVNAEIQSLD